ncbi:MAG: methyltransferase domain-containing protein [Verrucomicrobia bacterium]|nr:methyltransferase domain-containing protein [Verrucomicrobiota bacterium]
MNTFTPDQPRHRFTGLLQIARYNWPQYVGGVAVILVAGGWFWFGKTSPGWLRVAALAVALLATWWSVASLAASHWIYDVSELYRWTWIPSVLPAKPRHWLNLHAGLDESSAALRQLFPDSTGRACDFFDAAEMSEPSIQRARAERAAPPAEPIRHCEFPFADHSFDTTFVLFAAHELQRAASREAFFREIHRVLAPSGTILLVEHIRDLANFAAFGPGFLHFTPGNEWKRLAKIARLEIAMERRMTPFIKIILLRRAP